MLGSLSYIVVRLGFGTFNSYKLIKLLIPSASNSSLNALRVRDVGVIRWMYLALNIMANSLNFVRYFASVEWRFRASLS